MDPDPCKTRKIVKKNSNSVFQLQPWYYCVSKNQLSILYSKVLYKMGNYCLDIYFAISEDASYALVQNVPRSRCLRDFQAAAFYCISKKSYPFLCNEFTVKIGQALFNIQYAMSIPGFQALCKSILNLTMQKALYCICKQSCSFLYSTYTIKIGQNFLKFIKRYHKI